MEPHFCPIIEYKQGGLLCDGENWSFVLRWVKFVKAIKRRGYGCGTFLDTSVSRKLFITLFHDIYTFLDTSVSRKLFITLFHDIYI